MTEERYNNENDGKVQISFSQKNSMRLPSRYGLFKMRFEKLYGATDFEFKREESKTGDAFWKLK